MRCSRFVAAPPWTGASEIRGCGGERGARLRPYHSVASQTHARTTLPAPAVTRCPRCPTPSAVARRARLGHYAPCTSAPEVRGHRLPARSTSEEPIHARPHRRQPVSSAPPDYGIRSCNSYFTFTQTPPMTGTTLLYPGTTAGIVMPAAKRLFAVVHWASSANDTVVTECETPPPGLAFTTALKIINNHIPSPHDTVCSLPARGTICCPYRVGATPALGG